MYHVTPGASVSRRLRPSPVAPRLLGCPYFAYNYTTPERSSLRLHSPVAILAQAVVAQVTALAPWGPSARTGLSHFSCVAIFCRPERRSPPPEYEHWPRSETIHVGGVPRLATTDGLVLLVFFSGRWPCGSSARTCAVRSVRLRYKSVWAWNVPAADPPHLSSSRPRTVFIRS